MIIIVRMVKKGRLVFLILIFISSLPFIYAQEPVNFSEELTRKFLQYCEKVPREEIFVHTDRAEYIAGESLWFKIYLFDRQSNISSGNSRIGYFELLNSENRPVVQKRIKLDQGAGPGHIIIPDTLSTGCYTIRAYTNWMKNFLPVNCYMKNINIYNAISNQSLNVKINKEISSSTNAATNSSEVISQKGITFIVNNLAPDVLELYINTDNQFRSLNNNTCYLFIHTHGIINLSRMINLDSENIKIDISKNILATGINHITLFNCSGQPVFERFIYTPLKDNNLLTIISSDYFTTRNKISLDFEFDKELIPALGISDFSISVSPLTEKDEVYDIADYMVFGTEYGTIPNEFRHCKLNQIPPDVLDKFLLTVKSNWIRWDAILSGKFPSIEYPFERDSHFLTGTLLGKNTTDSITGETLFLSIPAKQAIFNYTRTGVNGKFSFDISITDDVSDLVIQPEHIDGNSTVKLESSFVEEYLPYDSLTHISKLAIPKYISKWSVNFQVAKIYELVSVCKPVSHVSTALKPKRFYGKPDIEVKMDDYIKLPVMSEVFFELTPGVYLKEKKSQYTISMADPFNNRIYDKPPVLFVDGVVIHNAEVLANLDPEIVEKIDVVKELYLVGDYIFFGLVNVITRTGDFSGVTLPNYAIRLKYRVVDPVVTFYSPDYSDIELLRSRVPDFRNTLYWDPSFKPIKEGKNTIDFWSSDIVDKYEVNINGTTADGRAISLRKVIDVK